MPEWWPHELTQSALGLAALFAAAFALYAVARWVVVAGIHRVVHRSSTGWDDALVAAQVFRRLAHLPPAIAVHQGIRFVPDVPDTLDVLVQRLAVAAMVIAVASSASAFLNAADTIYSNNPEYRRRPIKGYLQVVKIVLLAVATLVVVAALLDRSPWLFVSGIGAFTAVLMLIFKDTILSLVASVQIASNDMIHIGDWIEMPQAGADGDVIDVALHTVKVQNWDKTISTIPTHRFITDSFKNWRGMSLSGGRRIKRALHIDVNSIRFLDDDEIERFENWALLRDYIAAKRAELADYNAAPGREAHQDADIRRLTNVGTLRAYIVAYLRAHPKIHTDGYTLLVRQLQPGPTGLPIEIYCFSNDQDWVRYEGIQSDIFDHILAMVPEFGLRVFQEPAGADLDRVVGQPGAPAQAAQ